MNLELLIKLVKLANNNPNEHEANFAARKACKLIEESKFVFNNTQQEIKRPNIADIMKEYVKSRNQRPTPKYKEYWYVQFDENYYVKWERAAKKIKRKLKCKTCKQEKETSFVGLPGLFECIDCRANYNKNK